MCVRLKAGDYVVVGEPFLVTVDQYWDSASKTFKTERSVTKDTLGLVLDVEIKVGKGAARIEFREPFSQTGWVAKDALCHLHNITKAVVVQEVSEFLLLRLNAQLELSRHLMEEAIENNQLPAYVSPAEELIPWVQTEEKSAYSRSLLPL